MLLFRRSSRWLCSRSPTVSVHGCHLFSVSTSSWTNSSVWITLLWTTAAPPHPAPPLTMTTTRCITHLSSVRSLTLISFQDSALIAFFITLPFCRVHKFYGSHTAVRVPLCLPLVKIAPDTESVNIVSFPSGRTTLWVTEEEIALDSHVHLGLPKTPNSDPFLCSCNHIALCVIQVIYCYYLCSVHPLFDIFWPDKKNCPPRLQVQREDVSASEIQLPGGSF